MTQALCAEITFLSVRRIKLSIKGIKTQISFQPKWILLLSNVTENIDFYSNGYSVCNIETM